MTTTRSTPTRAAVVPCTVCGRLNRVDLQRTDHRPTCGACATALTLDEPIHADDANLEQIVREATVPVIVDFYADWCAPCRMMAPAFAELAKRQAGQALVIKVDTDRSPTMAIRHAIRGIPTVIAFRDGQEAARQVGAVPLARLEQLIDAGREGA